MHHDDGNNHHAREGGAGNDLLLRLEPLIRSVVAGFARDRASEDELMQICRIRLHEKREQCREPEAVFGWAKRLCQRVSLTAVRNDRRDRCRFLPNENGIASAETEIPDPLAAVETGEMRRRVGSAVEHLPPEQRRLVRMRYWQGLSAVDIARRLDLPAATVRTRLRRARRALQRAREIVCYAPRRPSLWSRRLGRRRMDAPCIALTRHRTDERLEPRPVFSGDYDPEACAPKRLRGDLRSLAGFERSASIASLRPVCSRRWIRLTASLALRPGRYPYCSGSSSASKIGDRTSIADVCATRSLRHGMPRGRYFPGCLRPHDGAPRSWPPS